MPTRRHIFCRSPLHAVIVLLLLAGLGGTLPAYAAPAAASAASADSPTESPGWFANQLSRFKSYPHLDMAYRRIREGKPEEALTEFEQTLQYAPQNRKARADYMNLLFSLKRYPPAEAQAKRLLTETPDDPEALLTLGLCQLRLGTPQAALANLQRALPLFAKDPKRHRLALLSTVEALAGSGRLQEARTLLDTLPADDRDFDTLYSRGVLADKAGDIAGAKAAYAKALDAAETDRQRLDALRSLAVTATKAGDLAAAKDALTKALALAPGTPDLLRQQAIVASTAKDYAAAVRLGRELVQRDPRLENLELLANALGALKKHDEAIEVLRRALAAGPAPEDVYRLNMHIGLFALESGKPDLAIEALQKAVSQHRNPLALLRLSRALQQAGRTAEAAKVLEQANALDPNPEHLVELATLLTKLDAGDAALAALDKALAGTLPPERRAAILGMKGMLQSEQGDAAGARRSLTTALAAGAGGDRAELSLRLGQVCLDMGDYAAAIAAYNDAIAAGAGRPARQALAEALVKDSKAKEALAAYEELAKSAATPAESASAREQLANVLSQLRLHARAAALYAGLAKDGQPAMWFRAGQSYAAAQDDAQALASFQAALQAAGSDADKAKTLLAIATIHARRRDYAKAYAAYSQAQPLAAQLPADDQAALAFGLGTSALLSGQPARAIAPLNQALGLSQGSGKRTAILLGLAQAYAATNQADKAEAALRQAAATPGASRDDVATAYTSLGHLLTTQDKADGAEAAFQQAWKLRPKDWRLPFSIGQLAYKSGRYTDASAAFSDSLRLHDDVRTRIALGLSDQKRDKPGLALAVLTAAAPGVGTLPDGERRDYLLTVGFLYAEEGRFTDAITAFRAGQDIRYDPQTATRLGRVERLAGHPQEARRILEAIDPAGLTDDLKRLRLAELASLAEADKNYDAARGYLTDSWEQKHEADTAFRLGNIERDSGHPQAAVTAYQQAVELDDSNQNRSSLGYALADVKRYREAADTFASVLESDPDYLSLWEDLGYAAMHDCQNAKASASFKQAIDNAPLRPADTAADREKLDRDVYRMRKEVTKLETHFTATAYLSYLSGEAGPLPSSGGGSSVDTIRSGGGVEVAWIPPIIGFRDDRIFQVIGRVTGTLQKDRLEFDPEAWQGAVGVRYKPLQSQNLNLGFERLFKIGQQSEENWLLRAMDSWTLGYELKPDEKWWNYTFLYGEYDYFTENNPRSMFYVEGRQGITFNIRNRVLLTPHVVADCRVWSPDRDESSLVEGGAGISLKYLFNRFHYEIERSSVEFLLQYKYGTLFNKYNASADEKRINALFLTTIVTF